MSNEGKEIVERDDSLRTEEARQKLIHIYRFFLGFLTFSMMYFCLRRLSFDPVVYRSAIYDSRNFHH